MTIKFGTDGWRAVIADEFTFSNVRRVTQAIANYLSTPGKIVVGYDNRFLAPEFARAAAEVMAANGFQIHLSVEAVPTPVVAWGVRELRALGAIMLTASHNPPHYAGLKFIPHYAGPALPDVTSAIEEEISRVQGVVPLESLRGEIKAWQPRRDYLDYLKSLIDFSALRSCPLKAVVDSLYGAGIGYVEEFLQEAGWQVKAIHNRRDPLFGGSLPDPSARGLQELSQEVKATGSHLGLALDGDADRFGVVDADGTYFTANQVLRLLLEYLVEKRGFRGPVARTVATTHGLDRIASQWGFEVIETPVGFKYIGQALREKGCILGGEESGGLSIKGHVPEKDGILACLLVAEMRAVEGEDLKGILGRLEEKYGPLDSRRFDLQLSPAQKAKVLEKLARWEPSAIGGLAVEGKITIDGVKFLLEGGSWCLLRPSGTEPVVRLYIEAPESQVLERIRQALMAELGL